MTYCPACGSENQDDASFCKKCGRSLNDVAQARAATRDPEPASIDDDGVRLAADGLPLGTDIDGAPGGERVLWKGRPSFICSPIRSIMTRFELTNERLKVAKGFVSRHRQEIDLYRVEDVDVKQGVIQRLFDLGNINLYSSDASTPVYTMYDVPHPENIKDQIRMGSRIERQRRRVILRDDV